MNLDIDQVQAQSEAMKQLQMGLRLALNSPDSSPDLNVDLTNLLNAAAAKQHAADAIINAVNAWEVLGGFSDAMENATKPALDLLDKLIISINSIRDNFQEEPHITADGGDVNVS